MVQQKTPVYGSTTYLSREKALEIRVVSTVKRCSQKGRCKLDVLLNAESWGSSQSSARSVLLSYLKARRQLFLVQGDDICLVDYTSASAEPIATSELGEVAESQKAASPVASVHVDESIPAPAVKPKAKTKPNGKFKGFLGFKTPEEVPTTLPSGKELSEVIAASASSCAPASGAWSDEVFWDAVTSNVGADVGIRNSQHFELSLDSHMSKVGSDQPQCRKSAAVKKGKTVEAQVDQLKILLSNKQLKSYLSIVDFTMTDANELACLSCRFESFGRDPVVLVTIHCTQHAIFVSPESDLEALSFQFREPFYDWISFVSDFGNDRGCANIAHLLKYGHAVYQQIFHNRVGRSVEVAAVPPLLSDNESGTLPPATTAPATAEKDPAASNSPLVSDARAKLGYLFEPSSVAVTSNVTKPSHQDIRKGDDDELVPRTCSKHLVERFNQAQQEATSSLETSELLWILPSNVNFTHDSINEKFTCGRLVEDTFKDLSSGRIELQVIPRLQVAWHNNVWFTYTGNRRLYVFRRLEELGSLSEIQVEITAKRIQKAKLTTKNGGLSVNIRNSEWKRQQRNLQTGHRSISDAASRAVARDSEIRHSQIRSQPKGGGKGDRRAKLRQLAAESRTSGTAGQSAKGAGKGEQRLQWGREAENQRLHLRVGNT